jgi:hypothetical protein
MTIQTILDEAEPDDAARAAQVMAKAVAADESLAERIREKARVLKAEAYQELTKLEGAE